MAGITQRRFFFRDYPVRASALEFLTEIEITLNQCKEDIGSVIDTFCVSNPLNSLERNALSAVLEGHANYMNAVSRVMNPPA